MAVSRERLASAAPGLHQPGAWASPRWGLHGAWPLRPLQRSRWRTDLDLALMSRQEKEATWAFLRQKLREWTGVVADAQAAGDKRCERAERQCCSLLPSTSRGGKVG